MPVGAEPIPAPRRVVEARKGRVQRQGRHALPPTGPENHNAQGAPRQASSAELSRTQSSPAEPSAVAGASGKRCLQGWGSDCPSLAGAAGSRAFPQRLPGGAAPQAAHYQPSPLAPCRRLPQEGLREPGDQWARPFPARAPAKHSGPRSLLVDSRRARKAGPGIVRAAPTVRVHAQPWGCYSASVLGSTLNPSWRSLPSILPVRHHMPGTVGGNGLSPIYQGGTWGREEQDWP